MIIGPNQVPKGSFQVVKYFDTYDEALSFKSYINSKTMSLMQFLGISGTTVTTEFFRFIPNQEEWNKVYTDKIPEEVYTDTNGNYINPDGIECCSLYRKYNLDENDINIIESIIKSRK